MPYPVPFPAQFDLGFLQVRVKGASAFALVREFDQDPEKLRYELPFIIHNKVRSWVSCLT